MARHQTCSAHFEHSCPEDDCHAVSGDARCDPDGGGLARCWICEFPLGCPFADVTLTLNGSHIIEVAEADAPEFGTAVTVTFALQA